MELKRKLSLVFSLFFVLIFSSTQTLAADIESSDEASNVNLPASYDLRNVNGKNYVTPVRNQGLFGTCWSFAAIGAIETNALLKGANPNIDLSEKALAWYSFQLQGSPSMNPDQYEGAHLTVENTQWAYEPSSLVYSLGGRPSVMLSQLGTWNGASTEEQIPYCNSNRDYQASVTETMASPYGDWTLPYSDIYDNAYHVQELVKVLGPSNINRVFHC